MVKTEHITNKGQGTTRIPNIWRPFQSLCKLKKLI